MCQGPFLMAELDVHLKEDRKPEQGSVRDEHEFLNRPLAGNCFLIKFVRFPFIGKTLEIIKPNNTTFKNKPHERCNDNGCGQYPNPGGLYG